MCVLIHLLPGPVIGPEDTSIVIIISALWELKSGEEMTFKVTAVCCEKVLCKDISKTGGVRSRPDEDGTVPL